MLQAGDRVERYDVEAMAGKGAMAVVYRVRHRTLRTVHALKVLTLTSEKVRDRMIQEGQVQAQLRHPNVLAVTDVLDVEGAPGLLMEFVDGPSLEKVIEPGSISLAEAERLFRCIVSGVQEAHAHGLVHRDLKPANVLCAKNAAGVVVPKVADFGLAKLILDEEGGGMHRTRSGSALGTPAYMAPEQIRDARSVDHRADLFALGAIFYELLCGKRAFDAQDLLAVFNRVAQADYVPLDGLPPRIARALTGLLVVDVNQRIGDCDSLLQVLDGTLDEWSERRVRSVRADKLAAVIASGSSASGRGPALGRPSSSPGLAVEPAAGPSMPGRPPSSLPAAATLDLDGPADSGGSIERAPTARVEARSPRPASSGTAAKMVAIAFAGGLAGLAVVVGIGWAIGRDDPAAGPQGEAAEMGAIASSDVALAPAEAAPPSVAAPAAPAPPAAASVTPAAPVPEAPAAAAPTASGKPTRPSKPSSRGTTAAGGATAPPPAAAPAASPAPAPAAAPAPVPAPPTAPGQVKVTSVPYSAVTIDGAGVGNSGRAFTVAAGSHRVGLRTTDGRTREATVVVAPGKVASFCWDFDAEAECS